MNCDGAADYLITPIINAIKTTAPTTTNVSTTRKRKNGTYQQELCSLWRKDKKKETKIQECRILKYSKCKCKYYTVL